MALQQSQINLEAFDALPAWVKGMIALAIIACITAVNYFYFIDNIDRKIKNAVNDINKKEQEITSNKIIAENLTQFQREHELLKQKLAEALTALPLSKNIDDLLGEMNANAKKAGVVIRSLSPKGEIAHGFYAAIPLDMQIAGTYHEIAVFFESISKLRRIVNISGISLSSARNESDRIVLTANYLATTFRFIAN